MKTRPPRWPDRFLNWYCRADLLEEIQGDAYELFYRTIRKNKWRANIEFSWNVIRFFRWKNIRKRKSNENHQLSTAMLKNILLVAVRNFSRHPGHSLLNVVGLSIAFACAFLILLWVSFEFSFDQFHPDSNRLYSIVSHVEANSATQTYPMASASIDVSSLPEVEKIVSVSMGTRWPHVLCFKPEHRNGDCIYLDGVYSNENFFSVFNFLIVDGDPHPLSKPDQMVISEKMAKLLFGDVHVVGKMMKVDDRAEMIIVSVMKDVPSNSSLQFDFVMPFAFLQKEWGIDERQLAGNFFNTYIRTSVPVSAGVLTEKLNQERVLTKELKEQKVKYQALPLKDWRLKNRFEGGQQLGGRMEYIMLFVIIGALLVLIAVINFVNMTTARATTRAKEIGIRKVIGAFRFSIILQFVGESFLIVLLSVLLAGLLAQFSLPYFNAMLSEQINVSLIDGKMPIYLLAFLTVIALLAGLYPAFILSSLQPAKVLKNQLSLGRTGARWLRQSLLVIQLSIAVGIVIFSGVLYRQLNFITKKNLGFDRSNMIRVEPTARLFQNFDAFKAELAKHPSIISTASANVNPLQTDTGDAGVDWPGKPKGQRIFFKTIACSYEFPETFGLKILYGRNFQQRPLDSVNTEALVSEEAVKIMNLTQPVGQVIRIWDKPFMIIGVTNDFHTESLHASRQPVILFHTEYMHTSAAYVKYSPGTTRASLEALAQTYKKIEPSISMRYWFQDDTFDEIYKTEITASRLVLVFTLVTLVVAIVGVAGLAAYNVVRRTKEIGVRRVFGASVSQVMLMLSQEFSRILLLATAVAVPLAWYSANRWLTGFAYRIDMPWWIFSATFIVIGVVVILIVAAQGFKTVTTNPSKTLRNE